MDRAISQCQFGREIFDKGKYSGSSLKRTPSSGRFPLLELSWPNTGMVLLSGTTDLSVKGPLTRATPTRNKHWKCKNNVCYCLATLLF